MVQSSTDTALRGSWHSSRSKRIVHSLPSRPYLGEKYQHGFGIDCDCGYIKEPIMVRSKFNLSSCRRFISESVMDAIGEGTGERFISSATLANGHFPRRVIHYGVLVLVHCHIYTAVGDRRSWFCNLARKYSDVPLQLGTIKMSNMICPFKFR